MRPVTYLNYNTRTVSNTAPSIRCCSVPTQEAGLSSAAQHTLDQVCLTEAPSSGLEEKTQSLLNQLAQNFPGIQFEKIKVSTPLNLKQQAALAGQGKHLFISESFLTRMGRSEQDFNDCKAVLLSSVLLLSENHAAGVFLEEKQAFSWNIKDNKEEKEKTTLAQMLKNLKEAGQKQKLRVSSNVSFETSSLYRKLAGSDSKALIQSVMGEAYQNMAALRMISCFGEDQERAKAQKAIRSLEKLMIRSRQKIRHVDQETLLKLRKRRAQKKQEEAKVRLLQQELKKKQSLRRHRDRKIISEGEAADQEIRRLKSYLSQLRPSQANDLVFAPEATALSTTSGNEGAEGACQISFSEPVLF